MRRGRPGVLVAGAILILVLLPMVMLVLRTGGIPDLKFWQDAYLMRALRFSLWQAAWSTVLSVVPAVMLARTLARRAFPGRKLLLGLFGLPLVVPGVVAVLGVISVFGGSGWLPLGRDLYGLSGILIAHVFFNLPLATRLLLPTLEQIPAAQWRLARQLGFSSWHRWWRIEWPALRGAVPGVAVLVFMLCLTSFAVVLSLGGGPRSTTLEVAIYQSLRFDFEPSRAVLLALLQFALCLSLGVFAARYTVHRPSEGDSTPSLATFHDSSLARATDSLFVVLVLCFVGGILLAIVSDGIRGPVGAVVTTGILWRSLGYSTAIALLASIIATCAGWFISKSAADLAAAGTTRLGDSIEIIGSIVYVVPPLVIGTGYFLLLHGHIDLDDATLPVVVAVNALMGIPFVIRSVSAVVRQRTQEYDRLCRSLGIKGWNRFVRIDFPLLRKPLGLAAALVAALSFGDLGVVALFGGRETVTLPLLLYQTMSAYRMPAAAVMALILLTGCLVLFLVVERIVGGGRRAAR